MRIDKAKLIERIDQLLAIQLPTGDGDGIYAGVVEAMQGTVTLAEILYGTAPEPRQVHTIMKAAQKARELPYAPSVSFLRAVWPTVQGSLRAMRDDIQHGFIGNLERQVTGAVIADMLTLAKEALRDGHLDVAAVLTSAAFEDTVRRMGTTLANVQGRPKLLEVLIALKNARVLTDGTFSTAQGFLPFRNDALHADWPKITEPLVASCLPFVERLIAEHLS